jgi:hypothetical protein
MTDPPDRRNQTVSGDTWLIEFKAVEPGPPTSVRVRRALKYLWRGFGLKCTAIRDCHGAELVSPMWSERTV